METSLTCNESTLSCHLISYYSMFLIPYTKRPKVHLSFKSLITYIYNMLKRDPCI